MAHPALARAVSASLQLVSANASEDGLETPNASAGAAWRNHTLAELEQHVNEWINGGIIFFWIIVLFLTWRKYKKTTSAVVLLWIGWFGFKLWQTHQAVLGDVETLASNALTRTRQACIAVYHMLLSWGRLVAPALGDLVTLLTPAAVAAWHLSVRGWNMSNWTEKGIFLLVLCVVAGVIFTVITMYNKMRRAAKKGRAKLTTCKDILKFALFQASFLVIGPAIWWITAELPGIFPGSAAILAMSVYPLWQSLVVMKKLQVGREALLGAKGRRGSTASGEDSDVSAGRTAMQKFLIIRDNIAAQENDEEDHEGKPDSEEKRLCFAVQDTVKEAREWLAYWSCWPIFFVAYWAIGAAVVDKDNDQARAYGLIVAMVLWVNIWGLKAVTAITPYFFALLIVMMDFAIGLVLRILFGLVGKATNRAAAAGMTPAAALEAAAGVQDQKSNDEQQKKLLYASGAVLAVLAVISFFFQAVAASTGVLTFFIQWGMAIEAAKRVQRTTKRSSGESFEMIPHRLAFWVIQTVWVVFVSAMQLVWLDNFLSSFTPFIFMGAIWAGEDSVKWFLKLMTCVQAGGAAGIGQVARLSMKPGERPSISEEPLLPNAS